VRGRAGPLTVLRAAVGGQQVVDQDAILS
jgi:hypothetical protein